jgi:2-methylisocitrate lyase-like PEP mutase family enzyme
LPHPPPVSAQARTRRIERQRAHAARFRALHQGPGIFVIGSVWDVPSAVIFEQAGFSALGTSSAGIAYSEGLPDGEQIGRERMLAAVQCIVDRVGIPVSADLESGFGHTPETVSETISALLETGAVGINIEDAPGGILGADTLLDLDLQVEKIRAMRAASQRAGIDLFINARTDGYWLGLWDDAERLHETLKRARAYLTAGADGIFVPGAIAGQLIGTLAAGVAAPLNILAMPGCPTIPELAALGVRRVSQGSGPVRAALALTRRIAEELQQTGSYQQYQTNSMPYAQANRVFTAGS